MGLLLRSFWLELALVAFPLLVYFYVWARRRYRYFEVKGVPYVRPTLNSITWATVLAQKSFGDGLKEVYDKLRGHKFGGFFMAFDPILCVRDPDLVSKILIKEFSNFHDRGIKVDHETNPLEGHLFFLSGDRWRTLRAKLSPTFTSGKLRWMFSQLDTCADGLIDMIEAEALKGDVDGKDLLARFTTDVIGSCAFGLEPQSMANPNNPFRLISNEIFNPDLKTVLIGAFRTISPSLFFPLKIKTIPEHITRFFSNLLKDTFEERKKSGKKRNDFVQLLLQLKEKGSIDYDPRDYAEEDEEMLAQQKPAVEDKIEMTDKVLVAQAFVFFIAGFETSATSLSFTFYYLAKHQEVQDKARAEVKRVKEKYGSFTYDALKELTYVENCFKEASRLIPAVPLLFRQCTKTVDLDEGLTVEKGSEIFIPVSGLHMDPELYKDPELFRPERFEEGEGSQPGTYLPFGDGPRNCIGKRFAMVEINLTMAKVLDNYLIEPSPKNVEPIEINPRALVNQAKHGIWLRFKKLPTKGG